eukprot:14762597-Ditylum_brightwellii.AAC.1
MKAGAVAAHPGASLMHQGRDSETPVIPIPTDYRTHDCNMEGIIYPLCQIGKGAQQGSGTKHSIE